MACNCVKTVNEHLANSNGKLAVGFSIGSDMSLFARLIISTEKLDRDKRSKPPIVSATHCPFCGTKFDGCVFKGTQEGDA